MFLGLAEGRGHDDCNILWQKSRVAGDLASAEKEKGGDIDNEARVAGGTVSLLAGDLLEEMGITYNRRRKLSQKPNNRWL